MHSMDARAIRLYVDGELSPSEVQAFERAMATDPDLRGRVAFERELRNRVMRTLSTSTPAAPAGAADAIRDRLQAEQIRLEREATPAVAPVEPAEADQSRGAGNGPAFFRGPTRANVFAVAACLAIVAAAVLFGIFGQPLLRHSGGEELTALADVSTYVESEHVRCASSPENLQSKAEYRDPAIAASRLTDHLGRAVTVFDLSRQGYFFVGGGRCEVPPLHINSCHLIYQSPGGSYVSVFMQPWEGQYSLQPGQSVMTLDAEQCAGLAVWTDGRIAYFLTVGREGDLEPIVASVLRQLN